MELRIILGKGNAERAKVYRHARTCLDAVRPLALREGRDYVAVYGLIDDVTPNIGYIAIDRDLSGERTPNGFWSG